MVFAMSAIKKNIYLFVELTIVSVCCGCEFIVTVQETSVVISEC